MTGQGVNELLCRAEWPTPHAETKVIKETKMYAQNVHMQLKPNSTAPISLGLLRASCDLLNG